jgi:hypothetical protein
MKTYLILDTQAEWDALNAKAEEALSIPDGQGTEQYATVAVVDNPTHGDFGKYIFPVIASVKGAFDSGRSADPDWFNPEDFE